MDKESLEIKLKTKLEIILQKMGVDFSDVNVVVTKNEEGNVPFKSTVSFSSDDANLIIGYHGETLQGLKTVLQQHIFREYGEWVYIFLNVGNYLEEKNNKLVELAQSASSKAKFLGKSVALYPMNSFERRIVHEAVANIDGVESYSEGEGRDRRVIIANKTTNES